MLLSYSKFRRCHLSVAVPRCLPWLMRGAVVFPVLMVVFAHSLTKLLNGRNAFYNVRVLLDMRDLF